jgi:hypothetical protein
VKSLIRYPIKEKVSNSNHKAYILIQAAINHSIKIVDFTLRVEQAEIVDNTLRLLKSLKELSIRRELGKTLESTTLLERSLETRLWEGNHGCVFYQNQEILAGTVEKAASSGLKSFQSIEGMSVGQLSNMITCTMDEANKFLQYSSKMMKSQLTVKLSQERNNLIIEIEGLRPVEERNLLTYELVIYHIVTGDLVCHRTISSKIPSPVKFVMQLKNYMTIDQIKCGLYSSIVGLDFLVYPKLYDMSSSNIRNNSLQSEYHQQVGSAPARKKRNSNISVIVVTPPNNDTNNAVDTTVQKKKRRTTNSSCSSNPFEAFKLQQSSIPMNLLPKFAQKSSSSALSSFSGGGENCFVDSPSTSSSPFPTNNERCSKKRIIHDLGLVCPKINSQKQFPFKSNGSNQDDCSYKKFFFDADDNCKPDIERNDGNISDSEFVKLANALEIEVDSFPAINNVPSSFSKLQKNSQSSIACPVESLKLFSGTSKISKLSVKEEQDAPVEGKDLFDLAFL